MLIDSSVTTSRKLSRKPTGYSDLLGKQGVAGAIPGGDTLFHFDIFAYLPWLTARRRQYT